MIHFNMMTPYPYHNPFHYSSRFRSSLFSNAKRLSLFSNAKRLSLFSNAKRLSLFPTIMTFSLFHTSTRYLLLPDPFSHHLKLSTHKDISLVDLGPFPKTEIITLNPKTNITIPNLETIITNPEIETTTLIPETTITLGASSETEITTISRVGLKIEAEIFPKLDTDSSYDDDPNIIPVRGSLLHSIDRKVIKDVISSLSKKTTKSSKRMLYVQHICNLLEERKRDISLDPKNKEILLRDLQLLIEKSTMLRCLLLAFSVLGGSAVWLDCSRIGKIRMRSDSVP